MREVWKSALYFLRAAAISVLRQISVVSLPLFIIWSSAEYIEIFNFLSFHLSGRIWEHKHVMNHSFLSLQFLHMAWAMYFVTSLPPSKEQGLYCRTSPTFHQTVLRNLLLDPADAFFHPKKHFCKDEACIRPGCLKFTSSKTKMFPWRKQLDDIDYIQPLNWRNILKCIILL